MVEIRVEGTHSVYDPFELVSFECGFIALVLKLIFLGLDNSLKLGNRNNKVSIPVLSLIHFVIENPQEMKPRT